jgi:hypothetical protein
MSFYSIRRKELTDIADAIRAKTGKSGDMSVEDMPKEIASITGGGSGDGSPVVIMKEINIGAEVSVTAKEYTGAL